MNYNFIKYSVSIIQKKSSWSNNMNYDFKGFVLKAYPIGEPEKLFGEFIINQSDKYNLKIDCKKVSYFYDCISLYKYI